MCQSNGGVLPFYLVVDVSWSMSLDGKLAAANRIVPAVVDALARDPVPCGAVRLALVDFADEARVLLPLCAPLAPGFAPPVLEVGGATSFSSAFTVVRRAIAADTARLRAGGLLVHRPAVFFVSDGGPTDDEAAWRSAFADLVTGDPSPAVVPCGVDQAEAGTMGSLVHPARGPGATALYMMDPRFEAAAAIAGIAGVLAASMIQSARGLAAEGTHTVVPRMSRLPAGLTRVRPGEIT